MDAPNAVPSGTRRRPPSPLPMIPDHVYHLVEASNWLSVERHGLLSTRELLRLTGVPPGAREHIATTQRLRFTPLSAQVGIRDQLPMPPAALQKCLVGMTPPQWYALLNQLVLSGVTANDWTASSGPAVGGRKSC